MKGAISKKADLVWSPAGAFVSRYMMQMDATCVISVVSNIFSVMKQQFFASLYRDKKERDAQIDASMKENKTNGNGVKDHTPGEKLPEGKQDFQRSGTGKEVEIADADLDLETSSWEFGTNTQS
jgi:hypothetical protein